MKFFLILFLCNLAVFNTANAQNSGVFIREEFNSLDNWEPLTFPKIERHSKYEIVALNDNSKVLQANSNNSASGLVFKKEFSVKKFPILRWSWKVSNIYKKGDAKKKSGDDYPIRIFVNFKFDKKESGFLERIKYGTAKTVYGEYPPHSALNYIWSNKIHPSKIITSSYTNKSKLIVVDSGNENINQWVAHEVNVLEDYRKAFGEDPPDKASLAVMSDSDDTGESAQAQIAYIEISN
jgi:hypothetical protein